MADKNLLTWLVILVCVFGLANFGFTWSVSNKVGAGISQSELKTAIEGIEFPEYEVNLSEVYEKLDSLELEIAELVDEDVSEEAEAERLVLLEIDSKDFKRAVRDVLNIYYDKHYHIYNCTADDCAVEKYRDITDIVVKDLDVVMDEDGETATVKVDLKIYYYTEGDEDETERARLEDAYFTVIDLDEDEDFEDAEVDYKPELLEVAKVY